MEEIYKKKYLKYKQKYVEYKMSNNKKIYSNQIGGDFFGITKEDFNNKFDKYSPIGILYLIGFCDLYNSIEPPSELNILIGAKNINDDDYKRFINSKNPKYSLFIDKFEINEENMKTYKERTFDMFTLNINTREAGGKWQDDTPMFFFMLNFNKNRLYNKVDTICVDINTSYFLSKNYINFALDLLKPGGKFIFQQISFNNKFLKLHDDNKLTEQKTGENFSELTELLSINRKEKKFELLDSEKILKFFDTYTSMLGPDFINIFYNTEGFTDNLYDAYLKFLQNKWITFTTNIVKCNFMNFTYPVPIPNLTTTDVFIKHVINNVMNDSEKKDYFETKTLTEEKLQELITRTINNSELIKKLNLEINKSSRYKKSDTLIELDDEKIRNYINAEFKKDFYYYVMVKN